MSRVVRDESGRIRCPVRRFGSRGAGRRPILADMVPPTRRMRRAVACALAAGLLVLAGCGSGSDDESDGTPTPSGPSPSASPEGTDGPSSPPPPSASLNTIVPSELESLVEEYNADNRSHGPQAKRLGRTFGADASWPQCPKGMGIPEKRGQGQPMPTPAAEFVILGLTNSPSFTQNPCLVEQVQWARERDLWLAAYAIVTFPDRRTLAEHAGNGPYDGSTRLGALRNVGFRAAKFNLATMREVGMDSPIVWVDVEPVAVFEWSDDVAANAAVVEGTVRGYRDAGVRVGFYSLPSMWSAIVGDLRFGAPEWRPAGATSMANALDRCGSRWAFQGGDAVFGQWVEENRDRNVTCPGVRLAPQRWFTR